MKEQDDVFKKFHESFRSMRGHFHILEQKVPVDSQMAYFKYSERLKRENPLVGEDELSLIAETLVDTDAPLTKVKFALTMLATSRKVKAFRILEAYVQHSPPEMKDWALLALMECRMGVESDLSDEKQIFISTGLGGKNEKLRFFVLFKSVNKKPFLDYQRQVIERELTYFLPGKDCEIERLEINERYVVMIFLIPVRSDLKKILDCVIQECNQYGNFLSENFTVTNVKELSAKEISTIIDKDGDSKTSY